MSTDYLRALARLLAAVLAELEATRDGRPGGEYLDMLAAWQRVKAPGPLRHRGLPSRAARPGSDL